MSSMSYAHPRQWHRNWSRLSRVEQIQLEEEQMRRKTISDQKHQAYLQRAHSRKNRQVPAWVRERDAQRKDNRVKAIESGEFVLHVSKTNRSRSRNNQPSLVDHISKKETKVEPKTSRWAALESDSDEEEVQEDYPQLAVPTKKLLTPLSGWASAVAKPAVKPAVKPTVKVVPEVKPAFKTQRPNPLNTSVKVLSILRTASVAPVKDNSAWSDDEDTNSIGALHKNPNCYNANGTMKSWADMCDSDSDDEDW